MKLSENWRLCHPVNIYVFMNGIEGKAPTLVHVPTDKKRSMKAVLETVGERMKFRVGYPVELYHMDGCIVCQTYELEPYGHYVVVTNLDRPFRFVCYGEDRSPLVVVGPRSKNIRNIGQYRTVDILRIQNRENMKWRFAQASYIQSNGFGPADLPYLTEMSKECRAMCQNIKKYSRFEGCPEPNNMMRVARQCNTPCSEQDTSYENDTCQSQTCCFEPSLPAFSYCRNQIDDDSCRGTQTDSCLSQSEEQCTQTLPIVCHVHKHTQVEPPPEIHPPRLSCPLKCPEPEPEVGCVHRNSEQSERPSVAPPATAVPPIPMKKQMVDRHVNTDRICPRPEQEHVLNFVNRKKDIGADLYKMFNLRLSSSESSEISRSGQNEKDTRICDDFYRKFYDRLNDTPIQQAQEVNDEDQTELDFESERAGYSMPSFQKLPSLPELKELDDKPTGNQRSQLQANDLESDEEYGTPIDGLTAESITAILASIPPPDEYKTGTTKLPTKFSLTERSRLTKLT